MRIPVRAVLSAIVGLVLLGGCSAAAPAPTSVPATEAGPATSAPATSGTGDQSVLEACTALNASMNDAAQAMQAATSEMGTDPSKAVAALETFQSSLEQAVDKVTNPQVRAQADKAMAATKKFVAAVKAMVENPAKATDMSAAMTEFQTEMTKIAEVCTAG